MNDRVHRYLDGEISFGELTADERIGAELHAEVVRRVLGPLLEQDLPDFSASVMSVLGSTSAEDLGSRAGTPSWTPTSVWAWLWRPRSVMLRARPAWGLAVAAAAALLSVSVPSGPPAPVPVQMGGTVMAASTTDAQVSVLFRVDAPGAESVHLAGDFTGWKPAHVLAEVAPGVWTATVPLSVGIHDYAFVVDGTRWVEDPFAQAVADGFGGTNSRVVVLTPSRQDEA